MFWIKKPRSGLHGNISPHDTSCKHLVQFFIYLLHCDYSSVVITGLVLAYRWPSIIELSSYTYLMDFLHKCVQDLE